jgi:nickel-dependent lactate racemase
MVEVWLPYGKTEVYISLDVWNFIKEKEKKEKKEKKSELRPYDIVLKALEEQTAPGFEDPLSPDSIASIALDGRMPPNLASLIISESVRKLEDHSWSRDKIRLVIANGTRLRSNSDLISSLNSMDILKDIELYEHTRKTIELGDFGRTANGTKVWLNRKFAESELKIAIGITHLDGYTGFTGAHTAVIPGITGLETIEGNRRNYFRGVKPGVIEANMVKKDAMEIANIANINLAMNLVCDIQGNLLGTHIGTLEDSWRLAIQELGTSYKIEFDEQADIVVVSAGGSLYDFDLYNASWALNSALELCKKNGAIILLAECQEGVGPDALTSMAHINHLNDLKRRYRLGAEIVHLIKNIARNHRIILVSSLPEYLSEPLGFEPARTANDAYGLAVESKRGKKTSIIPNGCITMPVRKTIGDNK